MAKQENKRKAQTITKLKAENIKFAQELAAAQKNFNDAYANLRRLLDKAKARAIRKSIN